MYKERLQRYKNYIHLVKLTTFILIKIINSENNNIGISLLRTNVRTVSGFHIVPSEGKPVPGCNKVLAICNINFSLHVQDNKYLKESKKKQSLMIKTKDTQIAINYLKLYFVIKSISLLYDKKESST